MSLLTRCPACETMFRVVPDQLRLSGGWVRCGLCHEAFDASAHLLELPSNGASEPGERLEPMAPAPDVPVGPEEAPVAPTLAAAEPVSAPAASPVPPPPLAMVPEAELPEVAFLQQDGVVRSRWHHPWARLALGVALMVLSLSLGLQVLLQERDRILAQAPGVRQVLKDMCASLRCSVWLPRQIDAVMIDSASLDKIDAQVFQLNFTIKNTAAMDLALPALELTLTDTQDQPFMRRVFRASELELGTRQLRAGAELSGKMFLQIDFPSDVAPLAGYRLVAFYPS